MLADDDVNLVVSELGPDLLRGRSGVPGAREHFSHGDGLVSGRRAGLGRSQAGADDVDDGAGVFGVDETDVVLIRSDRRLGRRCGCRNGGDDDHDGSDDENGGSDFVEDGAYVGHG